MFSFEKTIAIDRTPNEVFAFIADPNNIPIWRKDVVDIQADANYLLPGNEFEESIDFGHNMLTNVVQLVDMVPGRKLIYKVVGGTTSYLPLREMWFEQEGGHTIMKVRITVHTDGFTRLIQPITTDMFSIKWESYLFHVKRVLEAHMQAKMAA